MKKVAVILLLMIGLSFASAYEAEVVIIDEIGSFTGAVLKVKSPITKEVGEKIYASEYLTSVGIIKFNIETSLSEVFLNILITKDGTVVADLDEGPFTVNGSQILIDRREKVEVEDIIEVNESVENETIEIVEIVNESEIEVVVIEEELSESRLKEIYFTGKAMLKKDDGSFNWSYPIGSGVVLLMFIVFVFMFVFHSKPKKEVLSEDEKELKYMEKKVKETAGKIKNIKDGKARKAKLETAKAKLAEEERELKELERGDVSEKKVEEKIEKRIEKQEDAVEKAEERVEKAEE